jgi:hypothetical protein
MTHSDFFIKNQQDYNRFTEVTTYPPSFIYLILKWVHGSFLIYEMQNVIREVASSPYL